MRRSDNSYALPALRLKNLLVEPFHLGPMQLRPEVVFCMVAIVKPEQVITLMVRAYPPGDRFVWIPAVMEKIAVQIGAAVPQIIKREKINPEFPIQNHADRDSRS